MISKIKDKINASGSSDSENFIRSIIRIMKDFGYTYKETLSLPIPVYIEIAKYINAEDIKKKEHGKK